MVYLISSIIHISKTRLDYPKNYTLAHVWFWKWQAHIWTHWRLWYRRQSLYHSTTYVIDGSGRQLSSSQHTNHTALDYYPNKVCLIFLYIYISTEVNLKQCATPDNCNSRGSKLVPLDSPKSLVVSLSGYYQLKVNFLGTIFDITIKRNCEICFTTFLTYVYT